MVTHPHLLAAVDLGSNSFRLIVGRVEETPAGSQIYQVDALREPVRLGGGLSKDKMLDRASQVRGWDALKRFGERLRDFHPDQVRAVATNTLRVAKTPTTFSSRRKARSDFRSKSSPGARKRASSTRAPRIRCRRARASGSWSISAGLDGVHHRLALHADPHGEPLYRLREP